MYRFLEWVSISGSLAFFCRFSGGPIAPGRDWEYNAVHAPAGWHHFLRSWYGFDEVTRSGSHPGSVVYSDWEVPT